MRFLVQYEEVLAICTTTVQPAISRQKYSMRPNRRLPVQMELVGDGWLMAEHWLTRCTCASYEQGISTLNVGIYPEVGKK